MSVELVQWPEERERREELCRSNQPRLLMVRSDAPAPVTADPIEDWVRLPAPEVDVEARLESLRQMVEVEPTLDEDGVLRTSGGWVALPSVEARLAATMLERYGRVTDRESLFRRGWPDQEPSRNLLDVHLHRLRRRIEPVGLQVRTVRKRGYVLELA